MTFRDASAFLDALGIDAMKKMAPSLHRVEALCDALNHPERAVPAIHVTGTNGKTTVARVASALLQATGLTVGTYTSPHLQTIRERISQNGMSISEDSFSETFDHLLPYVQVVESRLGEKLTYFEILTGIYFLWASEAPVDVSVIEVGLGGTWDATNVIEAPVAVITNVALDHTELLGEDLTSIATEKGGIVKDGATAVLGERNPAVLKTLGAAVDDRRAHPLLLGRDFDVLDNRVALGGRYLGIRTTERAHDGLFLPLHGAHQGVNAAVALQAVTSFIPTKQLDDEVVLEGFSGVEVPGRVETIALEQDPHPTVVLDVAHNPEGMSALVNTLAETFAFDRVLFVVGVLADKDYAGMLQELTRLPCALFVCAPRSDRARSVEELAAAAIEIGLNQSAFDGVEPAVSAAIASATTGDLICITGSHYVVGEARSFLMP